MPYIHEKYIIDNGLVPIMYISSDNQIINMASSNSSLFLIAFRNQLGQEWD